MNVQSFVPRWKSQANQAKIATFRLLVFVRQRGRKPKMFIAFCCVYKMHIDNETTQLLLGCLADYEHAASIKKFIREIV